MNFIVYYFIWILSGAIPMLWINRKRFGTKDWNWAAMTIPIALGGFVLIIISSIYLIDLKLANDARKKKPKIIVDVKSIHTYMD